MEEKKLNVIDLFCGAGGLSEGFLQTGKYNFIAHVEWERPMVNTLRNNLVSRWGYSYKDALQSVIRFDVQKTEELMRGSWSQESIDEYAADNSELVRDKGLDGIVDGREIDMIIGGPPCQAYSLAGRAQDPHSMKDDYRNFLFESFVKVVNRYKPKLFVFENVPGILSAAPGDRLVIDRICEAFAEIGYETRKPEEMKRSIYSAADFQVPQERNRVIIIGVRKGYRNCVEDFYQRLDSYKSNLPYKTVRDAIGFLPKIRPLEKPYKNGKNNVSHELVGRKHVSLHKPRYNNERDIEVFRKWITDDMNKASTEKKLDFYYNVTGKRSNHNKYRNLEWDKPSPTIVSHLYKDGLMFIHPDVKQMRTITIREAALLQTFPIDYEFLGSDAYCFKMIGNAVPVLLANNIALAMHDVLKREYLREDINILVACEESQRVCSEFRRLGFNAFSCDLLECSGGHPEWHFKQDVLEVIKNGGGVLENGQTYYIKGNWNLMVAHPPCTFLAVSGAKWYYHPEDKDLPFEQRRPHPNFPNRAKDREDGAAFFMALANADIPYIAIENPVGIMNTRFRSPDQVVQPYHFGDSASKKTCLWLKNLPPLTYTKVVDPGDFIEFGSGRRLAKWYSDGLTKTKSAEERRTWRSKTFPGFAKAIAEQWGDFIFKVMNEEDVNEYLFEKNFES